MGSATAAGWRWKPRRRARLPPLLDGQRSQNHGERVGRPHSRQLQRIVLNSTTISVPRTGYCEAMSRENAEAIRRWLGALSDEDFEAALALVHPDVVLVPPGGQAPYRGVDSLRAWMEPDAFQDQVVTPVRVEVAADGTVLARQHLRSRGAGSGIELQGHSWSVWTFDDGGLITRIEIYLDHEEERAREAAGLSV